jgi:hypothetical protein
VSKNLFLIPIWKRPEITEICLRNLIEFDQGILCIVSNDEDQCLCKELGVNHIRYSNEKLGEKWNRGLASARELEWDYLVTLGSDDIVKESLFDFYISCNKMDMVITDKIHFIDTITGKATITGEISRARIGAGRRISRKVIEACNYKLWSDEKNRSLDQDSNATINRAGFSTAELRTIPHIVGLKSEVNIWKYSHLEARGKNVSIESALVGVLPSTKEAILKILPMKEEKLKFVHN